MDTSHKEALPLTKEAYSIHEVCQITSLSRSLIYKNIKGGKLKANKIGARTVILRKELLGWLGSSPDSPSTGGLVMPPTSGALATADERTSAPIMDHHQLVRTKTMSTERIESLPRPRQHWRREL